MSSGVPHYSHQGLAGERAAACASATDFRICLTVGSSGGGGAEPGEVDVALERVLGKQSHGGDRPHTREAVAYRRLGYAFSPMPIFEPPNCGKVWAAQSGDYRFNKRTKFSKLDNL